METPKQQAVAANVDVVQMHRDAIKMAKQQTRDIIARQKAEAKEQALAVRKAVEAQLLANQQANSAVEAEVIESIKNDPLEDGSSVVAESPKNAETPAVDTAQSSGALGISIGMPPSLQQTIEQMQIDAALEHQRMLADVVATMQQQRSNSEQ